MSRVSAPASGCSSWVLASSSKGLVSTRGMTLSENVTLPWRPVWSDQTLSPGWGPRKPAGALQQAVWHYLVELKIQRPHGSAGVSPAAMDYTSTVGRTSKDILHWE